MTDLDAFFAPGGPLAEAHPAYQFRAGQAAMATLVGQTIESGGRALIEAATGTGKTLAYLVPALASGRRVIVSTGTKNLQDQIWNHEIPFLSRQAGFEVKACVMKGRDNYLCRYRLAEFEREPLLADERQRKSTFSLKPGQPGSGVEHRRQLSVLGELTVFGGNAPRDFFQLVAPRQIVLDDDNLFF